MIRTSKQLKDKVRNVSKGNNEIAKFLIRTFMMERFLERISLSKYRDNFVLKGGLLVASIVGIDMRATMDIDTTVCSLPLNVSDAVSIVSEICVQPVDDNVIFDIKSVASIREEFDYPGIRIMLEARLDKMRQPIKLDISTGDVITPFAIEYEYKLMFSDRKIFLLSYNVETLLAEKLQTILSRGIANTRMRDFYDVYEISVIDKDKFDSELLYHAFCATCKKRMTTITPEEIEEVLFKIRKDESMENAWEHFRLKNYFVGSLQWNAVLCELGQMLGKILSYEIV